MNTTRKGVVIARHMLPEVQFWKKCSTCDARASNYEPFKLRCDLCAALEALACEPAPPIVNQWAPIGGLWPR